jgi:hypothetical protein
MSVEAARVALLLVIAAFRYGRRRITGEDMRPTRLLLAAALGLSLLA